MADTPIRERDPKSADPAPKQNTEFKVAEKREDGTIVLALGDGRMVVAQVADGVEGIHKGGKVIITAESFLEDGTPEGATVVKVA